MIRLQQVSVMSGKDPVLQNVSFHLGKGESLGIIGPNGAGKSTLLRVMGGHQPMDRGEVLVEGQSIASFHRKELAGRLAFMPQIAQVESQFTAYQTVLLARYPFLKRWQMESERDQAICRQSMERTCTWHLRDRRLDEVSGGERQRILLAQVLAQEPQLLLLDEPTTYLDLFHQIELLSLLKQEQKRGLTWAAVLHDLNLAAQYCDRLLLLRQGEVAMLDVPRRVFQSKRLEEAFGVQITMVDVPNLSVPQVVVTPSNAGLHTKISGSAAP
jgi:iron complex transport system ATP-binding protein